MAWLPDPGIGFFPVVESPYDQAYFDNYVERSRTEIGRALNSARVELLARTIGVSGFAGFSIVDVGIGSGQFVLSVPNMHGYDVNPVGVEWLASRNRWLDPNSRIVDVACFWDSLEHIQNPARLLANVDRFVLVSIPIFVDLPHVLRSKHFKPGEHFWYFTDAGFRHFMRAHGFACIEANDMESRIGREDIGTFVFARAG